VDPVDSAKPPGNIVSSNCIGPSAGTGVENLIAQTEDLDRHGVATRYELATDSKLAILRLGGQPAGAYRVPVSPGHRRGAAMIE
jgi:hypothetical protein